MKVKGWMLSESGCAQCDMLFDKHREEAGHTTCAPCAEQINALSRTKYEKNIS